MELFKQITIIGVGLMGGSLACAIKENDLCEKIVGVDINSDSLKIAKKRGIIDDGFENIVEGISKADLIIIAVPVGETAKILEKIKLFAPQNCLLVDIGSTKEKVVKKAKEIMEKRKDLTFIGGHPMTGSEQEGVKFSSPELFKQSPFILVSLEENYSKKTLDFIKLLKNIGAEIKFMGENEHDWKAGYVSHLPHLVSTALFNFVSKNDDYKQILELAGDGFKDTTRIAGSNSKMWVDICQSNQKKLEKILDDFIEELSDLKILLAKDDKQDLLNYFNKVSKVKNS
ncbi:MAG: prephenate dehydrogenase [Halanaerobiales bacterium]|nr:prephenate dehydrogenase [Halanaerobiales bacterium]